MSVVIEPGTARLPHVLLVEKDPLTAQSVAYALEGAGYVVTPVYDGALAIDEARRLKPSLIITEIILPGMNGLELCARLRADQETAAIPVLVFSVLLAEERALKKGASAFLLKPLKHAQLVAAVGELLHAKAERRVG